jgi:hypothetical protein
MWRSEAPSEAPLRTYNGALTARARRVLSDEANSAVRAGLGWTVRLSEVQAALSSVRMRMVPFSSLKKTGPPLLGRRRTFTVLVTIL